jgi:peptide/nickel transport system substrate-binding protein
VPQLAAALPVVSKNKLTYAIALRKGIVFNDGTPFNAQAVVTTIQRDLTLPGSSRASDLSPIDSVTATGDSTVVIHLKTRFSPLTSTLATVDGVVLSPAQLAKLGANFATNPICVGPFMYDNRVAGDSVTVIKSPHYYDQKDVHLDKIVFKVASDAAAAAAALKAGDLQTLDQVSPTELVGVQDSSDLRTIKQSLLGWQGIVINLGNKNGVGNLPYTNVGTPLASSAKLRQAFEEAIDRSTLVKVVLNGAAVPGCTPRSPASPWFDGSMQCTPYNPVDAKKLVAASGFANPTVHLMSRNTTNELREAQFIQAEEAAVGINVVIDSFDNPTFTTRDVTGNFDTMQNGAVPGSVDPDRNIYEWLASSGSRDYSGYSNPRLDLILANGRKATTDKARRTLYHVAEQIAADDRPIIFLFHAIRYVGVSTSVTGVQYGADLNLRVAFAQLK